MKNLTIINLNGVLCVDSREVADILEIEHKEFFRRIKGGKDIKGYLEIINEKYLLTSDYFIPSTYQDEDGKTKKNFLITRLGCQFLAYEYRGSVAVIFTAKYIKNFNEIKPEYKNIEKTAEIEVIKKLTNYAAAKENGAIDNYYKLRDELAHKIVDRVRGEKDPEEFQQSVKENTAAYVIDWIIFTVTKLKLEEEEIAEVSKIRIEQFQKAISQEYKE